MIKMMRLLLVGATLGLLGPLQPVRAEGAKILDVFMLFEPAQPVLAKGVKKLEWENLVPQLSPLKNPLLELSDNQREEFENITYVQSFNGGEMNLETRTEYKEASRAAMRSRRKLQQQGVDVDDVFDRYRKWQVEVDRRAGLTVKKYNGKQIAVAGYLLPLDFNQKGVKDFLLVPYVGACIHTPPPPINQTVFVHMKKPYAVNGLFDPVWVSGRMSTKKTSKKLSLVDGNNWVDAGYTLTGESIKKYEKAK